jgi:flagellar hook assembly protein FlgD
LQQNYPNPFNPSTQIRFAVEEEGLAQISIYNTKGQKITSIFNNEVKANEYYNVEWSGKDQEGKDVASGIYLYYLKTANKSYFKKMLLIK